MDSEVAEVEVQAQDLGENEKSWAALVSLDEEEPKDPDVDPAEKRGLKRLRGQFNVNLTPGQGPGDFERETDPATLARRSKQIEYGKISTEYQNYIKLIPKDGRDDVHPRTPNIKRKYSRRAFDGLVRQWRLNLHEFSQVDWYAGSRRTPSSSVSAVVVSTTTNETGESTSEDKDDQDHDHKDNTNDDVKTASPSIKNPKSRRRLI